MTTSRGGAGTRITIDWTILSIILVMLLALGTIVLPLFVVGA